MSFEVDIYNPSYGDDPKISAYGFTSGLKAYATSGNTLESSAQSNHDMRSEQSTQLHQPRPSRALSPDENVQAHEEWERYFAQSNSRTPVSPIATLPPLPWDPNILYHNPTNMNDSVSDVASDSYSEAGSIFDSPPQPDTPMTEVGSDNEADAPTNEVEPDYRNEFLFSSGGIGASFMTTGTVKSAFNPSGFVCQSSALNDHESVESSSRPHTLPNPSLGSELRREALDPIRNELAGTYAARTQELTSGFEPILYSDVLSGATQGKSRGGRSFSASMNNLFKHRNASSTSVNSAASAPPSGFLSSVAGRSLLTSAKSALSRYGRALRRRAVSVIKRSEDPRLNYETDFGSGSGSGDVTFTQADLEKDPASHRFSTQQPSEVTQSAPELNHRGPYTSEGRKTDWEPSSWI
ncbi:hypothetical protein IAT40_004491 [Kwoniella sp. CBS 6097]